VPALADIGRVAAAAVMCLTMVRVSAAAGPTAAARLPGGETTLPAGRRPAIEEPFANLSLDERFLLAPGRALFRDPWIAAPATTTARDGLGPLYNAHACVSCHPGGGRGALDDDGEPSVALLLRLARNSHGIVAPDPVYGTQLQTRGLASALPGAVAEGSVGVTWTVEDGTLDDGTAYQLRRPAWRVVAPAYGPLDGATRVSARLAPAVRGSGLLEAIPAAALLAREDPEDRDADGVSGRASRVPGEDGAVAVGRFGWKATQPSLRLQVASALRNDLGVTSSPCPDQPCSAAQPACLAAPTGADERGGVEIRDDLLQLLTRFTATLAVAARARVDTAETELGARLFADTGCAGCHVPSWETGAEGEAAAAGQQIWPYTDLLLHDMGAGLADSLGDGDAAAGEWRTPPLWGLGRVLRGARRTSLLHDGRARDTAEAILWHGGEAQRSRAAFARLSARERGALLRFLESL
jgi:CxxC motif-containing protein (DUF1111 family)